MISAKDELISIVIPTYNQAHFIGRSLRSVLDQTYAKWEAIVIDNHSQDNTDEVVRGIADPRITLLKINNSGVIAASRNMGIRAAKGEWVAFLDSDDWWTPNKLSECMKKSDEETVFLYHDLKVLREKKSMLGARFIKSRQLYKPVLLDLLAGGNVIANSSVVVRRRLLLEIGCLDEDQQMIGCEDYNAWLRIAQLSDHFLHVPQVLGHYRIHGQGASRKDMSLPMRQATASFVRHLDRERLRKYEAQICYVKARWAYLAGNYGEAKEHFLGSLCKGSINIRMRSGFMLVALLINQCKLILSSYKDCIK